MGENIFDTPSNNDIIPESNNIFDTQTTNSTSETGITNTEVSSQADTQEDTYSSDELNDPQLINVSIADTTTPLVVLFGPPACGKTMTLVRLARYLNSNGYEVSPIQNFRPAHDKNYANLCDGFDTLVSSDDAAASTSRINFMLIQVMRNGRRICQLLEAPGEFYFNPNEPNAMFPNFINTILSRNNRKIFALMVEPNWMNPSDRRNYVNKIAKLKTKMRPSDNVIVVFNKIDKTSFVVAPGRIHENNAIKEIRDLYPGIFEQFKNVNPITSLWRSYDCKFVAFQTGDYSKSASGKMTFQEGPDEYPRNLWAKITKCITG